MSSDKLKERLLQSVATLEDTTAEPSQRLLAANHLRHFINEIL